MSLFRKSWNWLGSLFADIAYRLKIFYWENRALSQLLIAVAAAIVIFFAWRESKKRNAGEQGLLVTTALWMAAVALLGLLFYGLYTMMGLSLLDAIPEPRRVA